MKGLGSILRFVLVAGLLTASVYGIPILLLWIVMMVFGANHRAGKAKAQVSKILMAGEELIAVALQHRVFGLLNRRATLAVTSSRIIAIRRGLLGGFKMVDIQWKDLMDATLEQNVLGGLCGSNLRFTHLNGKLSPIEVEGVPSDEATLIYAKAQAEEQAWEEKRRVRGMEEIRAASGGVTINAPSPTAGGGNRVLDEITKAKGLLDSGAISDVEFQEMKSKILAG